jgi:hypothetical protein
MDLGTDEEIRGMFKDKIARANTMSNYEFSRSQLRFAV